MLLPKAESKGLGLAAEVAADVPKLLVGDSARMGQIVLNLAGNAVKFTSQGRVRITVQRQGADELRIEVADTGIGIPADRLGTLFEKFTQADTSTRRRFGGTGLGLAISRRLVELMHGRIGVRSEEGAGSTFWLVVPLRAAVGGPKLGAGGGLHLDAAHVAPWVTAGERPRVLVVDDNRVNQHLARTFLAALQCDVEVVGDGVQAVARTARKDFALIFMDCLMPEMDGYEATRVIRQREVRTGRHVPIVAMTANAMVSDKQACADAGMDDYVAKPFRRVDLERVLQRWIVAEPLRSDS